MEKLTEKAEQIKNKQSWIRKGLQEILEDWAEETDKSLGIEDLEEQTITTYTAEEGPHGRKKYVELSLVRGSSKIRRYTYTNDGPREYSEKYKNKRVSHNHNELAFEEVKLVAENMKKAIEDHVENLEREYDNTCSIADSVRELLNK